MTSIICITLIILRSSLSATKVEAISQKNIVQDHDIKSKNSRNQKANFEKKSLFPLHRKAQGECRIQCCKNYDKYPYDK